MTEPSSIQGGDKPERSWWEVTYRGTAEQVVWVEASSAAEAKGLAEAGEYDEQTPVEWVKGKAYTMKAKRTDFDPRTDNP